MQTNFTGADVAIQDALEFLRSLPEGCANLIVSSPPYFMGKEYDSSMRPEDFILAHKKLLPELVRILARGGSLCWQVGHHVLNGVCIPLDSLVYSVFAESSKLMLRNRIVWSFGHGTHSRKRFSGRHESILWYTSGDEYYFNLDAVRVPQKYPGKKHYKGPKAGAYSGNPLGKNPSDVWEIPNVKAGHVEKTAHPCQFPVALVQRLIRATCVPGGLVVDPFCGSGSSAVAAVLEGRHFRGADIKSSYVQIARSRIDDALCGRSKIRPLEREIYEPKGNEAVAKTPTHFAVTRKERRDEAQTC